MADVADYWRGGQVNGKRLQVEKVGKFEGAVGKAPENPARAPRLRPRGRADSAGSRGWASSMVVFFKMNVVFEGCFEGAAENSEGFDFQNLFYLHFFLNFQYVLLISSAVYHPKSIVILYFSLFKIFFTNFILYNIF